LLSGDFYEITYPLLLSHSTPKEQILLNDIDMLDNLDLNSHHNSNLKLYIKKSETLDEFYWFQSSTSNVYKKNLSDPLSQWEKVAIKGNTIIHPEMMRYAHIDSKEIILTGGLVDCKSTSMCFTFSKNAFIKKANMINPRRAHAIIKQGGCLFACGGTDKNDEIFSSCEKYDLATEKWSNIANMNVCKLIYT